MRNPTARLLYAWLLRLHPAEFRARFGDEMMAVFEQALEHEGAARLLADAVFSLGRQHVAAGPRPVEAMAAPIFSQEIATSRLPASRFVQAGVLASGSDRVCAASGTCRRTSVCGFAGGLGAGSAEWIRRREHAGGCDDGWGGGCCGAGRRGFVRGASDCR